MTWEMTAGAKAKSTPRDRQHKKSVEQDDRGKPAEL